MSIVKRHPLIAFFVLAYALSWGNYFLSRASPNFPFLFPFGPLLSAIIVASVTHGMDGLRDLLSRCVRWRVGLIWYAAALFVPVGITLAAMLLNNLLGAQADATGVGPWYSLFLLFPMAMVDAPLQEEAGWRGYALPRFSSSRSPLANTLILGVLVVGWHLPVALGAPSIAAYMIGGLASAVLTNWVYYNARESALLAILYHTAQNTIGGFYLFRIYSGPDLVRMWLVWATVYSVVAAVVVLITGVNLRRKP
jgi:membrane protease YdiL (CAAX protease family)